MAKNSPANSPLTFDLPVEMFEILVSLQGKLGEKSVSAVIRRVLEDFDFSSLRPTEVSHRQISVRISPELRSLLAKFSRQKRMSAGALIRLAISGYKPNSGRAKKK